MGSSTKMAYIAKPGEDSFFSEGLAAVTLHRNATPYDEYYDNEDYDDDEES